MRLRRGRRVADVPVGPVELRQCWRPGFVENDAEIVVENCGNDASFAFLNIQNDAFTIDVMHPIWYNYARFVEIIPERD